MKSWWLPCQALLHVRCWPGAGVARPREQRGGDLVHGHPLRADPRHLAAPRQLAVQQQQRGVQREQRPRHTHDLQHNKQDTNILLLILKTLDCIHIIHISVPDNDTQDNPQLSTGLYLNFIHTWRTILFLRTLLTRSSSEMKSCWSSHSRPGMNCISLTLTLYIVASEAEYLNGLLS